MTDHRAGTRGLDEADFEQVAEFLHEAIELSLSVQGRSGRKLCDFVAELASTPEVALLRQRVRDFSVRFGMP